MAAAYVPPPPEDDFFEFSTQLEPETLGRPGDNVDIIGKSSADPSSLHYSENFGGDGFLDSSGYPYYPSTNQTPVKQPHGGQRVPETPALRRAICATPQTEDCRLNFSFDTPSVPGGRGQIGLRSVNEIPERYRGVFKNFPYFNYVQSKVFDDVIYTDSPLVTSAPTGSGKTVIFELAIIRLLMQTEEQMAASKVVYVAPIKALCSERFDDWQGKFGPLGLKCCELTGDSQLDDYFELQNANIVMTTPEKWDSMTRKWRDYKSLVQLVRLFLIDEVHQLNDESRGPTMEAIVSRMKTIRSSLSWSEDGERSKCKLRFIAISATMPNISDIAAWLGSSEEAPALECSIDESHRPVRLRRVVLGYPDANSEFKFDLSLNYRLSGVIQCYSDQKPTLVFCATRKGTQQAANTLVKDARFVMNSEHKQRLLASANSFKDTKLRELVVYGVGYHHAGMDIQDRKMIETLFTAGELPVLFATSTLAMGVNLPAHLVVIKSTMHYFGGMFQECSESQILQMIGRAGRPQFDVTATAVIMTRNSTKAKYEALLSGAQLIESNLHRNLIEHLNAEIVLHTITDVSIALEWLRSTFFYVRVKQNPKHYGMPEEHEQMEEKLQQLCLQNLNLLETNSLVKMDDGFILQPTEIGRLMARYCVAFESMKRFLGLKGNETLSDLVKELSLCQEFADVRLRVNEKRILNSLNKDKNKPTIRFPMNGKIKSTDMKVNCLIQAALGCLPIQEFGLNQDTQKIFRAAYRLSKCLMELQMAGNRFGLLHNAILLHKCLQSRLWENSKYVSKQLDKIGLTLSTTLVNAGLTSFTKIQASRPRELEMIMNRHPPFGNQISEAVSKVPHYTVIVEQTTNITARHCELSITVSLMNHALLKEMGNTFGPNHASYLLVGDADDHTLCKQRVTDSQLMTSGGQLVRKLSIQRARAGDEVRVHLVSIEKIGTDMEEVFTPRYSTPPISAPARNPQQNGRAPMSESNVNRPPSGPPKDCGKSNTKGTVRKACNHRCVNKNVCGHECCKTGVAVKERAPPTCTNGQQNKTSWPAAGSEEDGGDGRHSVMSREMERHVKDMHTKAGSSATPSLRNIKPPLNLSIHSSPMSYGGSKGERGSSITSRFRYTPRALMTPSVNDASYDSSSPYAGAIEPPSPSSNKSLSRAQQYQVAMPSISRSSNPRSSSSLSLNLKSSLLSMDTTRFSSTSTSARTALKPSPLTPKDPNAFFIDDFSDSFDDDFDRIDMDDCYVFDNENMPPRIREMGNDVVCTAVLRAEGGNAQQRTMNDIRSRAVERKAGPHVRSPVASKGGRLPFANRKRIIDEIYEDCGANSHYTAPPAKKCSKSMHSTENQAQDIMRVDGDVWKSDWKVEENVSKPQIQKRSDHRTDQTHSSCDFLNPSYELKREKRGHEDTKDEPSLARKLALRSGSADHEVSPMPQRPTSPSQQAKKATTSLSYHRDEEQQLPLLKNSVCSLRSCDQTTRSCDQTVELLPKPSRYSFFTAGPTSGADDDEGDMFGSIFAGIF